MFHVCAIEEVERFEAVNGIKLPGDCRECLTTERPDIEHPGVKIECPGTYGSSTGWFSGGWYSLGADDYTALIWPGMESSPEGCIDIAHDDGGKFFAMSLLAQDYGAVYHTDFECGYVYEQGSRGERNPDFVVARSFSEFLSLAEPANAEEIGARQLLEERELFRPY